jgi:hypothetical protein
MHFPAKDLGDKDCQDDLGKLEGVQGRETAGLCREKVQKNGSDQTTVVNKAR